MSEEKRLRINNKIIILNGKDPLSYIDLTTNTKHTYPDITLKDMVDNVREFNKKHRKVATRLKCAPDYFERLRIYLEKLEADEMLQGVRPKPEKLYLGNLSGIAVYIDPDMKPGEWKFE